LIPVVLFSSPLLVFTYLFNYFSGYFRSIYLNFRLANINPSGQIKFLIKNIAPYIFLDLVLTFILTWSTYSSVFWLFYYMSLIVILTTISFFTNVLKYFKEKRMMGNLISFGLSLFFSLVYIFEKGEIIFIGLSYILLSGLLIILYYVFYYQMFCKSLDKASH